MPKGSKISFKLKSEESVIRRIYNWMPQSVGVRVSFHPNNDFTIFVENDSVPLSKDSGISIMT